MKKNLLGRSITAITATLAIASYAQAGSVTSDGPDLVVQTKGGLKVSTSDKQYSIQLGGRIQYDYNHAVSNDPNASNEDQFDVRRARLFVKGDIQDWSYKSQFNVNKGTAEDVYIRYNGWGKQAKVTLGRQKIPFGLEELTSSKDMSMLERTALTEAYNIGRASGVQLAGANGALTYAVAAFDAGSSTNGADDFGFSARATFAPLQTDEALVHVGASYKDVANGVSAYALELAGVLGSLHGQVEFFDADNGDAGDADGYYAQVGFVITGEQRPYKGGVFKRIKPTGTNGALEVVARYEDGQGDFCDIELGAIASSSKCAANTDATSWGVGVNWYVNNSVRLGMNYTDGEEEGTDLAGNEFRARFQLVF